MTAPTLLSHLKGMFFTLVNELVVNLLFNLQEIKALLVELLLTLLAIS